MNLTDLIPKFNPLVHLVNSLPPLSSSDLILFFDTETTGLPAKGQYDNPRHPNTPFICEIAAILTDTHGNVVSSMRRLIQPDGWTIPPNAQSVHKISTQDCIDRGVPLADAIKEFSELSRQAVVLVAHNLKYDLLLLRASVIRLINKEPDLSRLTHICTMNALTDVVCIPSPYKPGSFKWPNLNETFIHLFRQPVRGAHGALSDTEHCYKIFFKHFYGLDLPLPSDAS